MTAALLEARGIEKLFGGTRALRGVDLAIRAGEVVTLMGANGAGKSTLVKILCGALSCDRGTLHLDGIRLSLRGPADARAAGIAVVRQATEAAWMRAAHP